MTTTLDLGYMPEAAALAVWEVLHGETYWDFRVHRGLAPGGMSVTVETECDGTIEEISGMALHVMAIALGKGAK